MPQRPKSLWLCTHTRSYTHANRAVVAVGAIGSSPIVSSSPPSLFAYVTPACLQNLRALWMEQKCVVQNLTQLLLVHHLQSLLYDVRSFINPMLFPIDI